MSSLKAKLYKATTPFSIEKMQNIFLKHQYDENIGYGFVSSYIEDDILQCSFIDKISENETLVDPFGNKIDRVIIDYLTIDFNLEHIDENTYLLSILTPLKSTKKFTSEIYQILNDSFFISSLSIDISLLLKSIKELYSPLLMKINKIKVSGLTISDDAKATIEIISKNNAINDFEKNYPNLNYNIDKIKTSFYIEDEKYDFEITKNGSYASNIHLNKILKPLLSHKKNII